VKGQTRSTNLGPLWRRIHRAKTHGRWRLAQPRSGVFWWTTPSGDQHRRAVLRRPEPVARAEPRPLLPSVPWWAD
jgi:hypothetical protein